MTNPAELPPSPATGGGSPPPPLPADTQDHLRLLALFHKIVAGIAFCFSMFPMIHVTVGAAMLAGAFKNANDAPPRFVGCLFMGLGGMFVLMGVTFAVCIFLAGRFLQQRRHYTYCLVVAGISTFFTPFGTVLGIFTIMVLIKPEVKAQFVDVG